MIGGIDTKFLNHMVQGMNSTGDAGKHVSSILVHDDVRKYKDANDIVSKGCLFNRIGTPDEVASVFAFLASKDASYISGEIIPVCGSPVSRL